MGCFMSLYGVEDVMGYLMSLFGVEDVMGCCTSTDFLAHEVEGVAFITVKDVLGCYMPISALTSLSLVFSVSSLMVLPL